MIFCTLGILFASILSLFYKKRMLNLIILILLFLLVFLFISYPDFFKSKIKNIYSVTVLLLVLFLHVFFVIGFPMMVDFSLRYKREYIPFFTKVFLLWGYAGIVFALYMFFVKGIIYD